jgi:dTDP-4-amino-4,6-dideoxygalactose transaminase
MRYATWGPGEYLDVALASLFPVFPAIDRRRELAQYLTGLYQARVELFNSGRSALEAALLRMRASTKDSARNAIVVPSMICESVPRKILQSGFQPAFCDLACELTLEPDCTLGLLGPDTAGVLAPHVYGRVSALESIVRQCRALSIPVVEDCAASFLLPDPEGRLSGWAGDYVILSFQVGKTIVAGSGGALLDRSSREEPSPPPPPWSGRQEMKLALSKIGFVLRHTLVVLGYTKQKLLGPIDEGLPRATLEEMHAMSAVDSRLVFRQMARWEELRRARLGIFARFASNLASSGIRLPQYKPGVYLNHLFVQFPFPILEWKSEAEAVSPLRNRLRSMGVQTHLPYYPAHWRPAFRSFIREPLPVTERFATTSIAVPSQPAMKPSDVDYICECLIRCAQAG